MVVFVPMTEPSDRGHCQNQDTLLDRLVVSASARVQVLMLITLEFTFFSDSVVDELMKSLFVYSSS